MAFRSEKTTRACLIVLVTFFASGAFAQQLSFEVRHQHWHGGAVATVRFSADSLSFEEHVGKNKTDSRQWRFDEIQQLTLSRTELRVLTYQDAKWQLGRDREYVFDHLPASLASELYPVLKERLDQRFVAALPDQRAVPEWKLRAKLGRGLSGTAGTLLISRDLVVFDTEKPNEARSWRITDIEEVSSSGPLDLTITTSEKSGMFRSGERQFHFQLQQALSESRYNALWREVNSSKGLSFLDSPPVKE